MEVLPQLFKPTPLQATNLSPDFAAKIFSLPPHGIFQGSKKFPPINFQMEPPSVPLGLTLPRIGNLGLTMLIPHVKPGHFADKIFSLPPHGIF